MSGINQILQFAGGVGANVMTPTDYAALAAIANGFNPGIAASKQLNTVWRQSSFVAAMIAQFVADVSLQDVHDDGNVANFEANFLLALANANANANVAVAGGTSDAITATFSPAITSLVNGRTLSIKVPLANVTTTPTLNINGTGAIGIVKNNNAILQPGDIPGGWMVFTYDSTLTKWVLKNPDLGASFGASLAVPGYQKLPGGLILQWGQAISGGGGTIAVTFPVTYVSTLFGVLLTQVNSTPGISTLTSETTSGFTVNCWNPPTGAPVAGITTHWFALGK